MLKKFFDYFLSGYATASVEVQKKARILLILNCVLIPSSYILCLFLINNKVALISLIIESIIQIISIVLIKYKKYQVACILINIFISFFIIVFLFSMENSSDILIFYIYCALYTCLLFLSCSISNKLSYLFLAILIGISGFIIIGILRFSDIFYIKDILLNFRGILLSVCVIPFISIASCLIFIINKSIIQVAESRALDFQKASEESSKLAEENKKMAEESKKIAEENKEIAENLTEIIATTKDTIINLNSAAKEIEAAAQEQTSGANEHASGVTEVSATLEELTITAKQITKNVGELVSSSEGVIKYLQDSEKQLLQTVSQLDDIGKISSKNATEIGALGKRAVLINDMVEMIKEIANKTNILSINASIEASRTGDMSSGFSVVAAEIRELSKETIVSAKNVEKAAKEIQDFLSSIIISTESESNKVIESGKTVKSIYDNLEHIVGKINNNYTFSQKIDVSIKQQENGSRQASDTMRQMAEIARQSAETARQTLQAVQDIVNLAIELDKIVQKSKV